MKIRRQYLICKNTGKIDVLFGCPFYFNSSTPLWPLWLCGWGWGGGCGSLAGGATESIDPDQ